MHLALQTCSARRSFTYSSSVWPQRFQCWPRQTCYWSGQSSSSQTPAVKRPTRAAAEWIRHPAQGVLPRAPTCASCCSFLCLWSLEEASRRDIRLASLLEPWRLVLHHYGRTRRHDYTVLQEITNNRYLVGCILYIPIGSPLQSLELLNVHM